MSNGNSPVVQVTITGSTGGGPVQISVDQNLVGVARGARGSTPPTVQILWKVASGSSANAKITNIQILSNPAGKTPPPGVTYSSWATTRPQPSAQGTSGNWAVHDLNDNNGTASIYYGYDITAQIGNDGSTSNTLDPGIDNQPPSP